MFEYVFVLTSIVIGLAVTHLMQGVAGMVQHPDRNRFWWIHLGWVAFMLLLCIFWWWWEFRLRLLPVWTFQIYMFVVGYAFLLYLTCAVLLPSELKGYAGYRDYFLARRNWFFGLGVFGLLVDLVDSLIKGTDYFLSLGLEYAVLHALQILLFVVGMTTRREWVQGAVMILSLAALLWQILRSYGTLA